MSKKYTPDEILSALMVISTVCNEQGMCSDECPLQINGLCKIENDSPASWDLNTPDAPWKAFRC